MNEQTAEIQLPEIFKSNLPAPTEVAAKFKEAFGTIYTKIEAEIKDAPVDLSTVKGRKAVASLAHKISRTKTGLENAANSLTKEQKDMVKVVVAERQEMSETLDKLRDKAREPLNKWEAQEAARVEILKGALEYLQDLGRVDSMTAPDQIRKMIDALGKTFTSEDWAEYQAAAKAAHAAALAKFTADLAASEKRIADEAELSELRELKAEQERKATAERLETERKEQEAETERAELERQRVATEVAEQAAADLVKAEQERAEQAEARAKQAEEQRKADAEQAEIDKKAAAEVAVNEEPNRLARIAETERVAEEARAADLKHRKNINNAALEALIKCSEITEDQGKMILQAVSKNQVPHVKISY